MWINQDHILAWALYFIKNGKLRTKIYDSIKIISILESWPEAFLLKLIDLKSIL